MSFSIDVMGEDCPAKHKEADRYPYQPKDCSPVRKAHELPISISSAGLANRMIRWRQHDSVGCRLAAQHYRSALVRRAAENRPQRRSDAIHRFAAEQWRTRRHSLTVVWRRRRYCGL